MNIKRGKILVNGSVVLDIILEKEFFGGTGANIAYGLGKFKTNPLLFSLVGKDFSEKFAPHLKKSGVDLRVHIDKNGKTANFSCTNPSQEGKQVMVWRANAYKNIHRVPLVKKIKAGELKKVSIAIFSPGTPKSIYQHLLEFRKFAPRALAIFDPGQMIEHYIKKQLINCINLTDIFIVNKIEYQQAKKILGQDPRKFLKNKIIIETQGEKGSLVFNSGKIIKIPAIRPKKVLDLTGAGDAYRAGLILGLWKGISLVKACTLGARVASKNIEYLGCQKY